MMITTVPSFTIALIVFFGISFFQAPQQATQIELISQTLHNSFNISPWLLIVPIVTALLILRKLPALVTLFAATVVACIAMVVLQPDIVATIGGQGALGTFRGLMIACSSTTAIETGDAMLNELVATRGMGGMMPTIWLILCAMCFGGVMSGSGMLSALTRLFMRFAKRTVSVVSSTIATGIFCNLTTADQYISIIITGNTFGDLYRQRGLEGRLLSRSVEDSATVTSVLIPWNSCGMTQSTVLGVATITYLPYCLFNLISPLLSIIVAATGYKIVKKEPKDE